MKNEKISIIVPVYKSEKYLNNCIDSILNQSYKNLEIVLVNDGSPDNSGKICDDYAKNDSRIKVIHKSNEGVSSARNNGIETATGEYIIFFDSDDFVPENSVKDLYEECVKNEADMAMCSFSKIKNGTKISKNYDEIQILNREEALKNFLKEEFFNCALWNKIFKRELIQEQRFDINLSIAEDFEFIYHLLKKVNKVAVNMTKNVYYYEVRQASIMQGCFNEKFKKESNLCKIVLEEIKKEYPSLEKYAIRRYQRALISCLSKCLKETGKIDEVKYMIEDLKKYPLEVKGYNKIRAYMLFYCKWMLKIIYKIYEKI